jgi:uncharacterized protein YegJ (DUF2314 family)
LFKGAALALSHNTKTKCSSIMKILLAIFTIVCSQGVLAQTEKSETTAEPTIYDVDSGDAEMNEAIRKSRLSFDEFLADFKSKKASQRNFSVKMPFATEYGAEHIWLTNMEMKDGKLFGIVDNLPQSVNTVRLGDVVEIDRDKISDWFYIDGEKLVGGLTIRVLRDRMKSAERKRFDRTLGVKLD